MMPRRLVLLCLTCLLALGAFSGFAGAASAAPSNDNFADAQLLKGTGFQAGSSLLEATRESSEPVIAGSDTDHTVWFRWVAPNSGFLRVSACGRAVGNTDLADFGVGIYAGSSVNSLTPLSQASGSCAVSKAYLKTDAVPVVGGNTYYVQAGHASADNGNSVTLYVDFGTTLPANDDWEDATVLPADAPQSIVTSTSLATGNNEVDLSSAYSGRNAIWYSWTSNQSGTIAIDTCSSATKGADSVLQVWDDGGVQPAALNTLNSVVMNDDGCDSIGNLSFLTFAATAGTQYWIRVSNYSQPFGMSITLNLNWVDSFVNIAPPSIYPIASDVGGNLDSDDGNWWSPLTNDISFTYQWQRCDVDGENCDDISGQTGSSYTVTEDDLGHTVRQAVTGDDGEDTLTAYSAATLEIGVIAPNDYIADAVDIGGVSGFSQDYTNRGADTEGTEADLLPQEISSTVWFKWTAPGTGASTVGTCRGTDPAPRHPIFSTVGVYTGFDGDSTYNLTRVASASDNCGGADHGANVQFNATAGTTYWIQVGSTNWEQGQFTLKLNAPAAATAAPGVSPPVATPVDPFPAPKLAKLGSIKQKKGKVTLNKLNLTCGATATGPCTGSLTFKTAKKKVKGKTVKSVSQTFKLNVKPGTKAATTFKLNKKLLAAIKKLKSAKTTVSVKLGAPGFSQKTASTSVTLKN